MSDHSKVDPSLLASYLSNDCSAEERNQVEQWKAASNDNRVMLAQLGAAWGIIAPISLPDRELSARQRAVLERVGLAAPNATSVPPVLTPRSVKHRSVLGEWFPETTSYKGWHVLAAALVVVTGALVNWRDTVFSNHARTSGVPSIYTTAKGQRANIRLPDGTAVSLNVASQLEVPVDYASGNRRVYLHGEALFTVVHHDGAPLTVVAGSTTTRVLGTSFLVRRYATDSTTTVAVRDGKVAVGATVLTAGRLVAVSNDGAARVSLADPSYFSFVTGILTLTSRTLAEAIPDLNRWYGADIRIADPTLAIRKIDGTFTAGSLNDLAMFLEVTFNARVIRDGPVLTLTRRAP